MPGRLILEAAGLTAGLAYLALADPHDPTTAMPACPVKFVSGLDCPACGGLRMTHDLLHGDLRSAVRDNAFLLVSSPVLVHLLVLRIRAVRAGRRPEIPKRTAYRLAIGASAWTIVRNLPAWRWKPTTD